LNEEHFIKINELLRSAYQIASREGEDTNWNAFKNNLEEELLVQSGHAVEYWKDEPDEQIILRATCTAKTYRVYPSE